ncbi:MAG: hypothetical protein ACLQRH_14590 [Acidimicrobiales bacterium]
MTGGIRRTVLIVGLLVVTSAGGVFGGGVGSAATRPAKSAHDRLSGPRTSPVQDTRYLADVAKADPALATYIQQEGNVALRAMLTDGSAFCAFLHRGGGIDNAILSVAIGARSVEAQTHLPSNVTTYNTMDAVALVVLCPSEQSLVPPSVRSRVRALGKALAK